MGLFYSLAVCRSPQQDSKWLCYVKTYKKQFCLLGPFVSVRRVVRSYSSTRQPSSKAALEAMAALQAARIGSVMKINKLVVFFKQLPMVASSHAISACGVTLEDYQQAFLTKDQKMTEDMQETIMNAHPQRMRF